MKFGLAAVVAFAALASGEALACSILPPMPPPQVVMIPGESPEAFEPRAKLHYDGFAALQEKKARDSEAARQADLWDRAARVAVVELVSAREVSIEPFGTGRAVQVKPVSWLKGKGGKAPVEIAHTSYTSCGASPWWDALAGKSGERFVVFFTEGPIGQASVMDAMAVGRVTDTRIIAALAGRAK